MLTRILLAVFTQAEKKRWLELLRNEQVVIAEVARKSDLRAALGSRENDLVIISRSTLAALDERAIENIRQHADAPEVIVITDLDDAVERTRFLTAGALAVLNYGLADQLLRDTVAGFIDRFRQADLQLHSGATRPRLSDFVSSSPLMQAFMKTVRRVLAADTPLLIGGETGVGKERLAAAIHAEGPRSAGPFIAINCGALSESLLDSELFGHEQGAFTAATRLHRGCFERAHLGVLFLDEINAMPLHGQVKLLRVLQEHAVQRIGGEEPLPLNVRVFAACEGDLAAEVDAGRFRRDLFYRLNVVTLTIPPLRDRPDDIPPLVESQINQLRQRLNSVVEGIAPEALEAMLHYHWPGNVRELINVVERSMLLCSEPRIGLADLPPAIMGLLPSPEFSGQSATMPSPTSIADDWLDKSWKEAREQALAAFERAYLSGLLQATGGRINETAKRAGIDPRSLYEKMRRLGLQKMEFRRKH